MIKWRGKRTTCRGNSFNQENQEYYSRVKRYSVPLEQTFNFMLYI